MPKLFNPDTQDEVDVDQGDVADHEARGYVNVDGRDDYRGQTRQQLLEGGGDSSR